jgi:hypothetical protein
MSPPFGVELHRVRLGAVEDVHRHRVIGDAPFPLKRLIRGLAEDGDVVGPAPIVRLGDEGFQEIDRDAAPGCPDC